MTIWWVPSVSHMVIRPPPFFFLNILARHLARTAIFYDISCRIKATPSQLLDYLLAPYWMEFYSWHEGFHAVLWCSPLPVLAVVQIKDVCLLQRVWKSTLKGIGAGRRAGGCLLSGKALIIWKLWTLGEILPNIKFQALKFDLNSNDMLNMKYSILKFVSSY